MSTICVECVYVCLGAGRNHVCDHPGLKETYWVTGEEESPLCDTINTEGTCEHYEAEEEIK